MAELQYCGTISPTRCDQTIPRGPLQTDRDSTQLSTACLGSSSTRACLGGSDQTKSTTVESETDGHECCSVVGTYEYAVAFRGSRGYEVEIQGSDDVGLLAVITRAIASCGFSIRRATIDTSEDGVVHDVFTIHPKTETAMKMTSSEAIRFIEDQLRCLICDVLKSFHMEFASNKQRTRGKVSQDELKGREQLDDLPTIPPRVPSRLRYVEIWPANLQPCGSKPS